MGPSGGGGCLLLLIIGGLAAHVSKNSPGAAIVFVVCLLLAVHFFIQGVIATNTYCDDDGGCRYAMLALVCVIIAIVSVLWGI